MLNASTRLSVFILAFMLLALSGCNEDNNTAKTGEPTTPDPLWSEYISAHTPPVVSRKSGFRIHFVQDAITQDKLGQDASEVITITPAVQGKARYKNAREIEFETSAGLRSGQTYHVSVKTDQLLGFPAQLTRFEFQVKVIEQTFEVSVDGLTASDADDKTQVLHGVVTTADAADDAGVEKLLSAQYEGQALPITWQHSSEGTHHSFTITGIQRGKKERALKLSWNGETLGVQNLGQREIPVPAIGVFEVSRILPVQDTRQYVQIFFSDAIDPNQNLVGLIGFDRGGFTVRVEGSIVKVYPDQPVTGEVKLWLDPGIRNTQGGQLGARVDESVFFSSQKPQVRFAGKGVILPNNKQLTIPFEALNVDSVQVTAFRVYESNMGQFLQNNGLSGNEELARVGRYLWRKTIKLDSPSGDKWNRYSLDASELLTQHPGALYRLTLSINRSNSTFACPGNAKPVPPEPALQSNDDLHVTETSSWDAYSEYYSYDADSGQWITRDDPCDDPYYRYGEGVKDERNFLASNIGIMAKNEVKGKLHVITTDIAQAQPMGGVRIEVMNFQNQPIGSATTDGSGFADIPLSSSPFYLTAAKNNERGYLKLSAGSALPISHFDAGGETVKDGIKGELYGERGVWRPGDKIYLTFVLQDKNKVIPPAHPVTLELYNPKGQLILSQTNTQPVGDFYHFTLKTEESALTGNWTAKAILGGSAFSKTLKIETVIPNRLKVELNFEQEELRQSDMPLKGVLFGQWLHGAKASRLRADVGVQLSAARTRFKRNQDFVFDDPAREFHGEQQVLVEGHLDEEGYLRFEKDLPVAGEAPGMLNATFTSRVFEESGAFSTSTTRKAYYPYENYVGIKLPKGDAARGMLLTDTAHTVEIASLDAMGEPVSLDQVQVTLYKIDWKWWWDKSGDSLAQYASAEHNARLQQGIVSTKNGLGQWQFEIKYPEWGRYLVRACDLQGQHCSGKTVYIDWPGWAGRAQEEGGAGANVLSFYADKPRYEVGETAIVQLPEATQGRALMSIENGSRILQQRWIEFGKDNTRVELPITAQMSPNVYVSITLVQPHRNKKNDRPIRLYGVVPILVNDPKTRLAPQLEAADEWRPNSSVSVKVSEAKGRAMTYTVAVVDEGLLGLTAYKTPDLHSSFYKKEALGIATWDMFDEVVGAYGGELERLLHLGGDGEAQAEKKQESQKRFPPVVRFLGPFTLKAGATDTRTFDLPQYVGAVRVMVVAGEQGAYGSTDKSVFVREPLSLLATLPRIIGPGEELSVPVHLFVMDPSIKDVTLSIETDEHFEVIGENTLALHFDEAGEKMGFLRLKVKPLLGKGSVRFKASSGKHSSESQIFLDVRSANPQTARHLVKTLQPGEQWTQALSPHGLPGTNKAMLELSTVPPINLQGRLDYLISYPHGCVEQTTSAIFPQLYLPTLTQLDEARKTRVQGNVQAGIQRLRQFQTPDGGFMYWPGDGKLNTWATNYVGHFLLEADKLGYSVPPDMLSNWLHHQKRAAQGWVTGSGQSVLDQTYRLYTLALATKPEVGAMNRLRESATLDTAARWQLAATYRLAGLRSAADALVAQDSMTLKEYAQPGETFASKLRDQAIVLNALVTLGDTQKAEELAQTVAASLSADQWHSTQSVAYALLGIADYAGANKSGQAFSAEQRVGNEVSAISGGKPFYTGPLTKTADVEQTLVLKNTSDKPLYAGVLLSGVPKAGDETPSSKGLDLTVRYKTLQGEPVDVRQLKQGLDFVAELSVTNLSNATLENIALTHILPSGWEIHNPRFGQPEAEPGKAPDTLMDYQDIRDDRVYTYFGIKPNESKRFSVLLNASYLGRYYLPAVSVQAMYDATRQARTKGQWVEVIKPER